MKRITGTHNITEEHPELLKDESSMGGGNCQAAAWPENAEEASCFMKECREDRVQVTISGARTGIAGGAVPMGGAVISTEHFRGIRPGPGKNILTVGAGETLDSVYEYCRTERPGFFYPPDPTESTASVGGTVATDASGSSSYLYGSTRRWIQRVRMILPSGTELEIRRGDHHFHGNTLFHPVLGRLNLPELSRPQPPKNAAGLHMVPGMDLIDLFIGSEGRLGLVAEADLILAREPELLASFAVFCTEEGFWNLRESLLESSLRVRELEAMVPPCISFLEKHAEFSAHTADDWVLITSIEVESERELDPILDSLNLLLEENGISPDNTWGGFDDHERKRLKDFRHMLPETVNRLIAAQAARNPSIHKISTDTAVPPERFREHCRSMQRELDKSGMEHVIFGHCGQNHLHSNLIPSNGQELRRAEDILREISRQAVDLGGTISAEHGTGKLKAPLLQLMYSPKELELMELLEGIISEA